MTHILVLEGCPFCGGDGAMADLCDDGYAMVVCVCTAQGPLRMGEAEAIAAWNTRRPDPEAGLLRVEVQIRDAYLRGWHEGIETLLEDYAISGLPEAPHKDAMNEGCGDYLQEWWQSNPSPVLVSDDHG